ncbi:jg20343 [Pararge aegeria aegeria]|uniref:Jg20343 protein n=1 Tax=Pararge aegeria aegeria TaxID=348720 RepID=A0A8S4RD87_9NEOP|nr:jg20343 [Pararge aegeria aegeria]
MQITRLKRKQQFSAACFNFASFASITQVSVIIEELFTRLPQKESRSSSLRPMFYFPDSRPELVYTFIEQAVQPGAQVALKCSAVGEPPPRFRWTLDGQNIPAHHGAIITEGRETGPSGIGPSSNYILSTLSLNSARVEHGGRYECRATNSHGSVAHAARLNVYGSII